MTKTIQQLSVESQMLIDKLSSVEIGQMISYAEMTNLIGTDIRRGRGYGCLTTARRRLLNDSRIHFCTIAGQGLKRSDDREKIIAGGLRVKKIKSQVRKGRREITSVDDYSKLPREMQVEHNAKLSALGFIDHMTNPKANKLITAKVSEGQSVLPIGKILEHLKES